MGLTVVKPVTSTQQEEVSGFLAFSATPPIVWGVEVAAAASLRVKTERAVMTKLELGAEVFSWFNPGSISPPPMSTVGPLAISSFDCSSLGVCSDFLASSASGKGLVLLSSSPAAPADLPSALSLSPPGCSSPETASRDSGGCSGMLSRGFWQSGVLVGGGFWAAGEAELEALDANSSSQLIIHWSISCLVMSRTARSYTNQQYSCD